LENSIPNDISVSMNVIYKCRCFEREREVVVPNRVPDTPIEAWMGVVTECLSYDHTMRSPLCRATEMEYVKIPVSPGVEGLGEKPVVN
jgi:hypothetical protein